VKGVIYESLSKSLYKTIGNIITAQTSSMYSNTTMTQSFTMKRNDSNSNFLIMEKNDRLLKIEKNIPYCLNNLILL